MDVLNTNNPKTVFSAMIQPPYNMELAFPNCKLNPSIIAKFRISMDALSAIMDLELEIKEIAVLKEKAVYCIKPMETVEPVRPPTMLSAMELVSLLDASIKNKEHVRPVMLLLDSNSAMASAPSITAFTLQARAA